MVHFTAFPSEPAIVRLVGNFIKTAIVSAEKNSSLLGSLDHTHLDIIGGKGKDWLRNHKQFAQIIGIFHITKRDSKQSNLVECDQNQQILDVRLENTYGIGKLNIIFGKFHTNLVWASQSQHW